jgi:hypothetical protein
MTCPAKWDFAYGGRLAGDALKPRHIKPILSEGRAWGAGVAAYHQNAGTLLGLMDGLDAMRQSIDSDLVDMTEAGVATDQSVDNSLGTLARLERMLHHYSHLDRNPLDNLTRLEDEIIVPVPSRTGKRGSTLYKYGAKIDGFTSTASGDEWIVEFKLRKRLQPRWVIELLRQYRWYAWARQRESGHRVIGVIVDERLNEVPQPPRILKDGSVSSAKRQLTAVDDYIKACQERGQATDLDLVLELQQRIWQQRVYIIFRPGELEEAGRELTAGALDIRDLDNGMRWPTRNASALNCQMCAYSRICADPTSGLTDELFLRVPPKRLRDAAAEVIVSG